MWPQAIGLLAGTMLKPRSSASCKPARISTALLKGLASLETLFGLQSMVLQYPTMAGMVISLVMWALYRGDQNGTTSVLRPLKIYARESLSFWMLPLNASEALILAVMKSWGCKSLITGYRKKGKKYLILFLKIFPRFYMLINDAVDNFFEIVRILGSRAKKICTDSLVPGVYLGLSFLIAGARHW